MMTDVSQAISSWIDNVTALHVGGSRSCSELQGVLKRMYSAEFLATAHYVVVDRLPAPPVDLVKTLGSAAMDFVASIATSQGVTYGDTYFITPPGEDSHALHCHELVHVVQWRVLGRRGFIERYVSEIQEFGYHGAPLERMAYAVQHAFEKQEVAFDVPGYVASALAQGSSESRNLSKQ